MKLLSPLRRHGLELSNRVVMAPLTRSRAVEGHVPGPLTVKYYRQRATAGLIVAEATHIHESAGGAYFRTPGIHSDAQIEGWKKVTEAVHAEGGKIFLQMWHVGRVAHPDFLGGRLPVAPSAIAMDKIVHTPNGKKPAVVPRALDIEELPGIVDMFRQGAIRSIQAGFDGVEIHGANGYLLDQFTRDGSNHRTDAYGGSLENRLRLPLEVVDAVTVAIGSERVGYRISPHNPNNSMSDSDPTGTFTRLARELDRRGLAYLHIHESLAGPRGLPPGAEPLTERLRDHYRGTYIVNGGYDRERGNAAIERGVADLVAYGVPYISNPDLVERFRRNAPLAEADPSTFYSEGPRGYIDYPVLSPA